MENAVIRKNVDEKLNIKPIYVHLIHRYPYMGPCRYGKGEQLEREYDEMMAAENFAKMKEKLEELYGKDDSVNVMEPVFMPQLDEFICREEELDLVRDDAFEADVFLLDGLMGQHLAVNVAKRFHKPMCAVGCCTSTDVTACLRAAGLESYGCIDLEGSKPIIRAMRARKGIRKTRILSVLKGDVISKGVESNIRDFDMLTNKWGITFKFINAGEFLDEIGKLTEEEVAEAEKVADDLIAGAERNYVDREYVVRSAKVYVTAKKMLALYDCNAFTIPCFEICATRRLNREKYTFCLTHSLLKEDGIPSACEADYNALVSMIVMMNLTDTAPHMGNLHPALAHEIPQDMEDKSNLIRIYHSVPTRKMHGRKEAPTSYGIQAFTEGGWGATLRHDFTADEGKEVTLVRFNPQGTQIMAAKGTIAKGIGYDAVGCDNGFLARVDDLDKFFEAQCNYGHHYVWVYGDVTAELKKLGELVGFTVELV